MFHKILVPIDGSEESGRALTIARELAEVSPGCRVTLLHVLAPIPLTGMITGGGETMMQAAPQILEAQQEEAAAVLAEGKTAFDGSSVTLETKTLDGQPAVMIIREAKEQENDLIVIGSRGRSAVAGFLLGSVSDAVVHHAHCPVLIVR